MSRLVELTEQDDGSTVDVAAGSVITVRLKEARTGGYQWAVDEDGSRLVALVAEHFRPAGGTGGQAEHEFQLVATEPGTATLTLVHRRSWSPADPSARRWQVRLHIIEHVQRGEH